MTIQNTGETAREVTPRPGRSIRVLGSALCVILVTAALGLLSASKAAADTRTSATHRTTADHGGSDGSPGLDMRDDQYNSDYIFGMSKGVANSTIHPAVKPLFFVVTIPLDLAFLPFAAIGGFF